MLLTFSKKAGERIGDKMLFTSNDFDCPCARPECNFTKIDTDTVHGLEEMRDAIGPLQITSGFRCQLHNADIGGEPHSFHCLGMAADVIARFFKPEEVRAFAERVEVFANGGIGAYNNFSHLDSGPKRRWDKTKPC